MSFGTRAKKWVMDGMKRVSPFWKNYSNGWRRHNNKTEDVKIDIDGRSETAAEEMGVEQQGTEENMTVSMPQKETGRGLDHDPTGGRSVALSDSHLTTEPPADASLRSTELTCNVGGEPVTTVNEEGTRTSSSETTSLLQPPVPADLEGEAQQQTTRLSEELMSSAKERAELVLKISFATMAGMMAVGIGINVQGGAPVTHHSNNPSIVVAVISLTVSFTFSLFLTEITTIRPDIPYLSEVVIVCKYVATGGLAIAFFDVVFIVVTTVVKNQK